MGPTARIVRRRDCTGNLFLLWLEPSVEFHFTPGQYITIGVAGTERPYSIASAPYEPHIELFVEYVREYGGRLSPLLFAQRAGDVLLLIVGGDDKPVIALNEQARAQMQAAHVELAIVPGATHLFEEPGTLEQVEQLAGDWFLRYLRRAG